MVERGQRKTVDRSRGGDGLITFIKVDKFNRAELNASERLMHQPKTATVHRSSVPWPSFASRINSCNSSPGIVASSHKAAWASHSSRSKSSSAISFLWSCPCSADLPCHLLLSDSACLAHCQAEAYLSRRRFPASDRRAFAFAGRPFRQMDSRRLPILWDLGAHWRRRPNQSMKAIRSSRAQWLVLASLFPRCVTIQLRARSCAKESCHESSAGRLAWSHLPRIDASSR